MRKIGMQLIAEKKAAILAEQSAEKYAGVERKDRSSARDLLTLLLKANMATDIPDNQRLSDEDFQAREYLARSNASSSAVLTCFISRSPDVRIASMNRTTPALTRHGP